MQQISAYFRQFGRFQHNARLYLLSNALSGVSAGIFLVLYNLYLTSLGYKADFVGLTLFVGTVGAGLAIFPAGMCIDRWSGKWILIISSLAIGLAGSGAILFRQPGPLLVCAFFTGIAAAFVLVINAPFLLRNSVPAERNSLFSLNIALTQITAVLGEILGGSLPGWFAHSSLWMHALPPWLNWLLDSHPEARSYQLAMLVAGLISIPSFIPLFLLTNDRPQRAPVPPDRTSGQSRLPWREWLASARKWTRPEALHVIWVSPFFALVMVYLLTGLGAGLIIPYFNLFFVRHLHASPALFGLIDGAANGLTALTTLCAPWLARRVGRVNSIALTRLVSLPLLIAIGFSGELYLTAGLYPLREGLMDMSNGILAVFSLEEVPEPHRGLANSVYSAISQAAPSITSPLAGLVIVAAGYQPLFLVTLVFYLASIALLWGRFGGKRGQLAEQTDASLHAHRKDAPPDPPGSNGDENRIPTLQVDTSPVRDQ
jgi:MFS family permease